MKINQKAITLENGIQIDCITLCNTQGMEVEVLTLGGIIKSINAPDRYGKLENILLEYDNINTYIENPGYLNALIGRTAGRVSQGEFTLGDVLYKVGINEGKHSLHGGVKGLDKKIWQAKDVSTKDASAVELSCLSLDQEEGYPGNLEVKVTYALNNDNTFDLLYQAVSDQDTIISLTNHGYFNLSGNAKRPITEHELMIKGSHICELDEESIATGKTLDVSKHTAFDFRKPKIISQDLNQDHIQLATMRGYDHPWILDQGQDCAVLYDEVSGRRLDISTDQEVVVVYTMNYKNKSKFTNAKTNIKSYGITFETQGYPIGHNECFKEHNFLRANETYTQKTKWKFTTR